MIGSLDSLLAAVGEMDGPLDTGHQPNRLLIALGCGQHHVGAVRRRAARLLVAPCADAGARGRAQPAAERRDARRRWCCCCSTAARCCSSIPLAVLAGMMTVIAFSLINRWAGAIVQRARRRQYDRELTLNIVLVVLVAGVTIVFGLVHGGGHRAHPVDGAVHRDDEPVAGALGRDRRDPRLAPGLPAGAGEPAARAGQADQGDRGRRRDLLRHRRPPGRRGAAGRRGRELRDPRPATA